MPPSTGIHAEFFVACLCAAWCGTCREYQPLFEGLATAFPEVRFQWVDVEDEPEVVGELDIENFPTVVIQRGLDVLFCGTMLPHITQLERLLQTFLEQSAEESRDYVGRMPERLAWQGLADIRGRLKL